MMQSERLSAQYIAGGNSMDFEGAHDVRSPRRLGAAIGMMVLALSLGACSRTLVGVAPTSKDTKAPAKTAAAGSTKTGAAGTQGATGAAAGGAGAAAAGQSGPESKPLSPADAIAADADGTGTKSGAAGAAGTNADGTAAGGKGAAGSNAAGATAAAGAGRRSGCREGIERRSRRRCECGGRCREAGRGRCRPTRPELPRARQVPRARPAPQVPARRRAVVATPTRRPVARAAATRDVRAPLVAKTDRVASASDQAEEAMRAERERAAALEAERRGRVETAANRVVIDQDEKLQTLGGTLPATFNMDEKGQFEFDRYTLSAEVKSKLDEIGDKLKDAPYDRLIVHGYTDRIGTDDYNQELSEKRAWAVAGYLMDKGVPPYKLTVVGRGKTAPLTTPDECKGLKRDALIDCLQRDRRVEVVATLKEYNLKVQVRPRSSWATALRCILRRG